MIRALRSAGYDLQQLIHEDKIESPQAYPEYAGQRRPDTNIDHRRVPNQIAFLRRHAAELTLDTFAYEEWLPGDIVYWKLHNGLDHAGVVSDRRGRSGNLMVIHNISVCAEEDCLNRWKIVGHFRFPKEQPAEPTQPPSHPQSTD